MALILASTSAIRRQMLDAAGVCYEGVKPNVDENIVKARLDDAEAIASELAAAKARSVVGSAWVIGSDSVVSVGGRVFDKPSDRKEATEHLRFFSGKEMVLTSAVALARNGVLDWRHVETARLRVRPLSKASFRSISMPNGPKSATLSACSGWRRGECNCSRELRAISSPYLECR